MVQNPIVRARVVQYNQRVTGMEQRPHATARLVPLHADDGRFDREFWAGIDPTRRLELVWDMVAEFLTWRGLDAAESRLQRSVCRLERLGR
ncbi:MAG: hypothetical protein IMZ44_22010 [Planctomycetes bacterium]|nr:hypothetical protein [Planctomycetota bacterium]